MIEYAFFQRRVHLLIFGSWRIKGRSRINFSSTQPKTTKLFNAFRSQNENQCLWRGIAAKFRAY